MRFCLRRQHRRKDGKCVVALTFLFRQNSKNAAKLDTMQLPHDPQMELEIELLQKPALATAETDSDRVCDLARYYHRSPELMSRCTKLGYPGK